MSYLFGALEQAIQAAEKAAAISPSFALAHLGVGMARLYAGDAAGSIEPLERGLRLNPFDPQNFHWFRSLALAFYFYRQAGRRAGGCGQGVASTTCLAPGSGSHDRMPAGAWPG